MDFLKNLLGTSTNPIASQITEEEQDLIKNYLEGAPAPVQTSSPLNTEQQGFVNDLLKNTPMNPAQPMGMAESLRSRSGDDMMQEEPIGRQAASLTMKSSGPVNESFFRKEGSVQGTRNQLDLPDTDKELEAAIGRRDNLLGLMGIAQGLQRVGTGIARVEADPNYASNLREFGENAVKDTFLKRKAQEEQVDLEQKKFNFAFAKDKDDPNSPSSNFYRNTMRELTATAGINLNIPDNLSAAEMERLYPSIVNLVNAKEAREARMLQIRAMTEGRRDRADEKADAKAFQQETKLRDEASKIDEKTGFSQVKFGYENLKNALAQGKWTAITDIQAIYSFIKGIDPGSVVRESETELVLSAQSPLAKYGNQFRRITKGDLASPEFRKKLMDAYGQLYQERKSQFEYKLRPTISAANKYGLNTANIVSEVVPGFGGMQQEQQAMPQFTPQQNAGIDNFMKKNNIKSREEAISILKKAGKL